MPISSAFPTRYKFCAASFFFLLLLPYTLIQIQEEYQRDFPLLPNILFSNVQGNSSALARTMFKSKTQYVSVSSSC